MYFFITQAIVGVIVAVALILTLTPAMLWIDGLIIGGSYAILTIILLSVGVVLGRLVTGE